MSLSDTSEQPVYKYINPTKHAGLIMYMHVRTS